MNPIEFVLVVGAATAASIAAMLLVRRRSPAGSRFEDGDRAAGVFGVLATGFALLLGLVVVLAFTSYDASRVGAADEARVVIQQFETAQFLPPEQGRDLAGQIECYGRAVVHQEWPAMEAGDEGDGFNPWTLALFRTFEQIDPQTPAQQAAYAKWMDQTTEREDARNDRIHGATGVVPAPLWIVLIAIAIVIFLFLLLFADSAEPKLVQASLMGSVVIVMTSLLLLISYLDQPYAPGVGRVRPEAMERTLRQVDAARLALGLPEPPCDARGEAAG